MPASSVSGLNSWGLYLISAVALVLIMTPQLSMTVRSSREAADWRYLDGIRETIDSLQPGVTIAFTLVWPLPPDPVRLGGNQLSCDYGEGTIVLQSRWVLPNATLTPGSRYLLRLDGDQVMVTQTG